MTLHLEFPWLDSFVLSRDHDDPASLADLNARVRASELVRVVAGVYLPSSLWDAADDRLRHLFVMRAAMVTRMRRLVFSHWSATAGWGLPILGKYPADAHAVDDQAEGGRSDERLVRHCVGIPLKTVVRDGLELTSLARTVVDISRISTLAAGLVVADAALARVPEPGERALSSDDLLAELSPPGSRGIARARRVAELANGLSGSPGETLSRVSMFQAGLAIPELQTPFTDAYGDMFVDFWWPRYNVIGEFDGAAKYLRAELRGSRTPAEVVVDEKWREDRLRALGPRVVRWGWDVAGSPSRLRAVLNAAGVFGPERYPNRRRRPYIR